MSELKDKLLETVQQAQVPVDSGKLLPHQIPKNFIDIPSDVIHIVATYLDVIFKIAEEKKNKEVDIKRIINNAKILFGSGAKWNDEYWMQHCAASIRELITFVTPSDFNNALSCIPEYVNPAVEQQFKKFENIKDYLSCIVHFAPKNRPAILDKIYPNQSFNQLTKEKLVEAEDYIFEIVCIDLIYLL